MLRRLFTINRRLTIVTAKYGITPAYHAQEMPTYHAHEMTADDAQEMTADDAQEMTADDVNVELSEIKNDLRFLTEKVDRNKATIDEFMSSTVYAYLFSSAYLLVCIFATKK